MTARHIQVNGGNGDAEGSDDADDGAAVTSGRSAAAGGGRSVTAGCGVREGSEGSGRLRGSTRLCCCRSFSSDSCKALSLSSALLLQLQSLAKQTRSFSFISLLLPLPLDQLGLLASNSRLTLCFGGLRSSHTLLLQELASSPAQGWRAACARAQGPAHLVRVVVERRWLLRAPRQPCSRQPELNLTMRN